MARVGRGQFNGVVMNGDDRGRARGQGYEHGLELLKEIRELHLLTYLLILGTEQTIHT